MNDQMQAIWNDVVIAESNDTVVVEGNHYFPFDSIKNEYFQKTELTTLCGCAKAESCSAPRRSACGCKGVAGFSAVPGPRPVRPPGRSA